MSNKNKNKFQNKAARRFAKIEKVAAMPQAEIFDLWATDLKVICDQMTAAREHRQPNSQYPQYVANGFANLSSALFFYRLTNKGGKISKNCRVDVEELTKSDVESIREIIAEAYRKNNQDIYQKWVQDYADRRKLLSKAFVPLYDRVYKLTKMLKGLSKSQRRDLTIQIYGDPIYSMKVVHKILNNSTASNKKKMRFLQKAYGFKKKMYGKRRFVEAMGAAMTVDNLSSDSLGMMFDFIAKQKKRKRAPYILEYARAYKKNQTRYFQINAEFLDGNKGIVRELKDLDIGFKKAVKATIKKEKDSKSSREFEFKPRKDKDRGKERDRGKGNRGRKTAG